MTRRKPIRRTIPDVRQAPPRPVSATRGPRAGYPTAAELVSSSAEWRRWLDDALRSVLRPAALAGAVGLAASATTGCTAVAEEAAPRIAALLAGEDGATPEAPDAAASAPREKSGVVMFPVSGTAGAGGGSHAGSGGVVAHPLPVQPPQPPPSGGPGDPGPPAVDGDPDPGVTSVGPKPPVLPSTRPPQIRGRIRVVQPDPDPPALPGGL